MLDAEPGSSEAGASWPPQRGHFVFPGARRVRSWGVPQPLQTKTFVSEVETGGEKWTGHGDCKELGLKMLEDQEIKPLIPILKAMGPSQFVFSAPMRPVR